jgi:glutathione S-transferase
MTASSADSAPDLTFYTLDMCPYAQRVWILLEELHLPYTRRTVDLRTDPEQREWFLREINPRGKVPALCDRSTGLTVFESLIVNEYLCDKYRASSASVMPDDAVVRARIRLWNEHLDSQLAPAHFTLLMNKDEESKAVKRQALDQALQVYEEALGASGTDSASETGDSMRCGPYLCGAHLTLADISALPFFERMLFSLQHYRDLDPLAAFPRTAEWWRLASSRPSFATTRSDEAALEALYDKFLAVDYSFGGLAKK